MTNYFKKYLFKLTFVFVVAICGVLATSSNVHADTVDGWSSKNITAIPGMDYSREIPVALNDKIYFPGSDNFIEYNPADGSYSKKTPIPEKKVHPSVVALDNKIYVIGGSGTNSLYVYDPATDTWATKANMPGATYWHSAVVLNGKIYVSGGNPSSTSLMVYDPVTNTWTKETDTPYPIFANSSVVLDNKIYIFGGLSYSGNLISKACVYDPIKKTWKVLNQPPAVQMEVSAVVYNDKIYIIDSNYIFIEYNAETDTWTKKQPFPKKNSRVQTTQSLVFNNKIHTFVYADNTKTLDIYEDPNAQSDAKLTLEDGPIILEVGQTYKATATITPKSAANQKIIWSISDPSVATIDQNGVLTGVSEGYTLIKVTSEDGKLSDMCKVQVKASGELPISKNRALLRVALTNGSINEYDLSMTEVQNFINWYNGRAEGKGKISFAINKNANVKPFKTRTDYLVFDKIYSFEVNEYELNNNEK